jgi:hypothetical protein
VKIAYADPPYIGQSMKHYGREEVDHRALIEKLVSEFPEGWALSCSSPSLQEILALCPVGVRVASWVKPFCSFKPGVNPAYAWEPVVFMGGRKRERKEPTVRDWVATNITFKKGLSGAKPLEFCCWLFDLMGMKKGDELIDLFPGTGAVTRAWKWLYE